jgi:magnesium transporter
MIEMLEHNKLNWIHILNPSDQDYQVLLETYKFHPLDIEDVRSKKQRPKIDEYDNYNFIILQFPYYEKTNRFLVTKEVKIFWGADYLITIGNSHWVVMEMFTNAKENNRYKELLMTGSSDTLLYRILERLLSETYSILNKMGNELEMINSDLFEKRAEKIIDRISIARKNLILLNTIIKPQIRLFSQFESGHIKGFSENMEEYWGDILDSYHKNWDMIEDYEELIEGLSKTFDSLQANKINEIMKVLTFFSSIMLPLTFISGLYGMNIGLPFQSHPYAFLIVIGFCVVVVLGLLYFFRRRRWI